ncbi:MAG: tetratricopeptide repeat protein [Methanobacteriota archaeon]
MRPKKSTYTFSVAERILLCLKEHHTTKTYDIPQEITQRGISSLLNIRTFNVSRYLISLKKKGQIQMFVGRPKRCRKRMQFYLLTESGYQQVIKLHERAADTKVKLVFPSEEIITNLYDAPSLMPGKPSLTELITATRTNSIDVTNFIGDRARRGGGIYRASPEMPIVEQFYGRTDELDEINEWYRSNTEKILSIVGMAGIGKTALLARVARGWIQDRNVFWYKLREYDTPWSVAHAISTFLSTFENRLASNPITERDVDIGLISYILTEEIKNIEMVFVFDDLHKASEEALTAIRAITDIAMKNKNIKIATTSRKYIKMVDRRIHMAGVQLDMKIDGLDPPAAAYLLPKGLNGESDIAKSLIRKTGGHPLLIKSAMLGIAGDFGLLKYVQDEIVAGISKAERNTLKILALLRMPVKKDGLYNLNIKIDDVESLDGRGLIEKDETNGCEIHEVIKEFMISRMGKDERKSLNMRIAEMYSSRPGELFSVESIYHSVEAGDYERGAALLMNFGESIVTFGMAPRIAVQVKDIAKNFRPVANSAAKYFRILGDVFEQLGEWDEASTMYSKACGKGDDVQAALALTRLGEIYFRRGKLDDMETVVKKAVKISERTESPEIQGECQYSLGTLALKRGLNDDALKAFEIAINKAQKSDKPKLLAKALIGRGRVEHAKGNFSQAIIMRQKAASIFTDVGDKRGLSKALTGIGSSYFAIGDNKMALEYHEKAAKVIESIGDVRLLAYALANAGGVLIKTPNYKLAEINSLRAISILEKLGETDKTAPIYQNLSLIYRGENNLDKALDYALKGHKISLKVGTLRDIARADAFLGEVLLEMNRCLEARKYYRSAVLYARKVQDKPFEMEMVKGLTSCQHKISSNLAQSGSVPS